MALDTEACLTAIASHSGGLARVARGNLGATVEHCPGWSVADLVWHVTEVHWFWATIVAELADAPPDPSRRPTRPPEEQLLDSFAVGARRLVDVLGDAEQSAPCWTWAAWRQDVAFVTRHQVQEAAVHHWDAAHASGSSLVIEPPVATDSIDEFLHFSVASDDDPDDPVKPPLNGALAFRASEDGTAWTLRDGRRPGTASVSVGAADAVPLLEASASDLLLWLYGRVELDTSRIPDDLLGRFRAMCFTD